MSIKKHIVVLVQIFSGLFVCPRRIKLRKKAAELKSKSGSTHKSMGIKITENRIAMMESKSATNSVEINDLVYADGSAAGTEVILKISVSTN